MALSPRHYCDISFVSDELQKVFGHSWFFLGLKYELPDDLSYKRIQLFNQSFVVQRTKDEFHAFANICPHRGSEIISDDSGVGKLKCPYHGWIFDGEGRAAIVERNQFLEPISDKVLKRIMLGTCGQFIFGSFDCPQDLQSYLGEKFSYLESISEMMSSPVDRNSMIVDANWKVVVENTLEGYHAKSVHPETLTPQLKNEWALELQGIHSTTFEWLNDKALAQGKAARRSIFNDSGFEHYRQDLIFPNLTVATTANSVFFIQEIHPISVNKTRFVSHAISSETREDVNPSVLEMYLTATSNFNRKVFDEDKDICNRVQRGLEQQPNWLEFEFHKKEERVRSFQESCEALLTNYTRL